MEKKKKKNLYLKTPILKLKTKDNWLVADNICSYREVKGGYGRDIKKLCFRVPGNFECAVEIELGSTPDVTEKKTTTLIQKSNEFRILNQQIPKNNLSFDDKNIFFKSLIVIWHDIVSLFEEQMLYLARVYISLLIVCCLIIMECLSNLNLHTLRYIHTYI